MQVWRLLAPFLVLALAGAAMVVVSVGALPGAPRAFAARLTGDQVVPSVETPARGDARCQLSEDGQALVYKLDVSSLEAVTTAHIRLGRPGELGPAVATLYRGPAKEGSFTGTLAQGTLRAADLTGQLKEKSLADLLHEIETGNAYVDLSTEF